MIATDPRRVVVAHEADAIREVAVRVVREAGYEPIGVAEGESAHMLLMTQPHPAALVVDVGLPGRLGYELVEDVRNGSLPTRVILVASVYSKTAYKRRPTSLYGADDYVEQHHIPDELAGKLARLVPLSPGQSQARPVVSPAVAEEIRVAGEKLLEFAAAGKGGAEAHEEAHRLARLIVADMALYNGMAFEGNRSLADVQARLGDDLRAARELFSLRVPREIAGDHDFVGAALAELVAGRGGA